MKTRLLYPIVAVFAIACTAEQPSGERAVSEAPEPVAANTAGQVEGAPYTFEQPDVSYALPEELMEISGLTVLPDGHLGAVQDEEGILFALNRETGAVEARYPFEDAGDYEGIEVVGDRVFILRSNGTLLELTNWSEGAPQVQTHKTDLKGKNDTEGLGYDEANHRLLIALKEDPGADLNEDQKAVYAFDPSSGELAPEPAYIIDLPAFERQFTGKGTFKPSALAVHPASGAVYVLSSVAKALAVLGEDGSLQLVWRLPEAMFEQPEGLAFLPDGTLFISSEGGEGPAMVYRFSYSGPNQ